MIKKLPLITCFFMYSGLFAQNPALLDNDWFLTGLTQDGEEINIPNNDEVSFIPLNFEKDSLYNKNYFNTEVCNYHYSEVEFENNNDSFIITFSASSLVVCNNLENQTFERPYFDFYDSEHAYRYSISEENNIKTLIITNPNGADFTKYTSTNLSTTSAIENKVTLYPNPTQDKLVILGDFNGEDIIINTIEGKKVSGFEQQGNTVDISRLQNGLYFLSISNGNQRQILKFIKK